MKTTFAPLRCSFLRNGAPALALLLGSAALAAAEPLAKKSAADEQTFFAFDDYSVPWRHNLKLTLVAADKHPANPVLRRGPAGAPDHGHAVLYGTVLKQGDTFRMWYLGMHETENKSGQAPGWWRPMCYAESKDGVQWTKPELGLVEFNGSTKNNICLIEGEPHSLTRVNDFLSVLFDEAEADPAKRYKCAYIAHPPFDDVRGGRSKIGPNERRWGATICATSADGLKWKVVGDRPANAGGERFEVSSLYRFGGFYYTTGQLLSPWTWRPDGSEVGRVMLAYRSPDFVTWSKATAFALARPGQLATPPVKGQQMHMGAGLWNRGNVLVGLHGMWQDAAEKPPKGESWNLGVRIDLGLCVSNDGIHFREPVPSFAVIPRGPEGAWDDIAILQGHAFVNEGDRTMLWYSHWDTGGKLKTMEIGLATLRRDGFGHLSRQVAGETAECVTSLRDPNPAQTRLYVNADGLTSCAPLRVELLDEKDHPLAGYSGPEAARVLASGLRQEVIWPGAHGAALPPDRRYAVKVTFPSAGDAKLYALYFATP